MLPKLLMRKKQTIVWFSTFLGRGKVSIHSILWRPHMWDYTGCVVNKPLCGSLGVNLPVTTRHANYWRTWKEQGTQFPPFWNLNCLWKNNLVIKKLTDRKAVSNYVGKLYCIQVLDITIFPAFSAILYNVCQSYRKNKKRVDNHIHQLNPKFCLV